MFNHREGEGYVIHVCKHKIKIVTEWQDISLSYFSIALIKHYDQGNL